MTSRSNFSRLMLLLLAGSLTLLSALALMIVLAPPQARAQGSVIYVDRDAPGPNHNGLTWTSAYTNLQDALTTATTGNEIWVAEGVYYPDKGGGYTAGNQAASFFLKSGVGIYGGFAATETLRTQRNWNTHITVLSGDLTGNDTANAYGVVVDWENVVGTDNTYQVVTAGYYDWGSGMDVTVDATAVLDGFTITAGRDFRDAILQGIGAGLITYRSNPTLRHLVFSGNQATVGGGIYLWEGPAIAMTDLTFTGNVATQGGGLYCRSIPLTLDQFLFQNNDTRNLTAAVQAGGGMATTCNLTLTHGQFISNTAGSAGGLSTSDGSVNLSQVVFESNRATEGNTGAGGMVSEAGNPVLTDVAFINNTSNGWGGGYYHQNSALTLSRVKFIGNVTTWSYGGGLAAVYAPTVITNALFAGNVAAGGWGSGMLLQGQSMTMTNAVFQGNGSDGLTLYTGATAALRNVTVSGNGGMGINLVSASNLQVSNSIIYGNGGGMSGGSGVSVTYSIVGGGCPSGATCDQVSNTDPLFVLPVVPSAVPTSTGDLRLSATSPAIDAGDNSAVPASLTTDLDGNPRFVDTPAVADTGSGTPPIVDRGAYEYPGKPDLEVSKKNNVGGAVAANTPFSWTLTISNTGGDTATFAANTVILQDDLPSANASYGASASIQNATGLSGPLNCTVSAYTLICRANGGAVTLAAAGQFTVAVPVNTSGIPILVNPRSGGACRVDPNNVISELLENNNTCNSDTVAVGQTNLTVALHDTDHTPIVQAPIGVMIHAAITVTGVGATPTGSTHLYRYNNSTCSGSPTHTNNQSLVNGAVESASFAATSFYYRVLYSGDSTHESVYSPCTQFRAYQTGSTFTVNTPADDDNTVDGLLCSEIHCTLREAILAANTASGANTILFAIGSGQTITLTSALPAINDTSGELTIDGQTYAVTVSGVDQYRQFTASNNARTALANLTLVRGNYTGSDCSIGACGGSLKVESGATVTLTHSAILSGTATGGGGIYNLGTLIIQQSTVAGSSADEGGGILHSGGTLLVRQSTLAGNTALYGGGILVVAGTVTLENSTLSGNTATGTDSKGGGGAIDLYNGTGVITNSTIVSNTAVSPNQAKSGLWLENGTLRLRNSIVASNNGANNFYRTGGTFTSQGYNLADAWNGLATTMGDLTADPKLDRLADNGGGTLTHALKPDSPAVDHASNVGCPLTDQRGISRPQGLACDIGAYEITGVEPQLGLVKTVLPQSNVPYQGIVTYTLILRNQGTVTDTRALLTDTLPTHVAFNSWVLSPINTVQAGNAITWSGSLAPNQVVTWTFRAIHNGTSGDVITNTAYFSGSLQQGSAAATFQGQPVYVLTMQLSGNGSGAVLKTPDQLLYPAGTVVTLTALPDAGSHFTGWSGGLNSTTNPITLTMDADKAVTGTFALNTYTLTLNTSGNGTVTSDPPGSTFTYGTVVTLTATPGTGSSFVGWSGGLNSTTNPITLTMDADKLVTGTFALNIYTLTLNTSGNGTVTSDPPGSTFTYGTVVTLTATPGTGSSFVGWSGALGGGTNPITLTMDADKVVTGTFALNTYTLTLNTSGNGAVTSDPPGSTFTYGSVVTLTALPSTTFTFVGWSGAVVTTTNPLVLIMDADKAVTATFKTNRVYLPLMAK